MQIVNHERNALVTGAAGDLGRAISIALIETGAKVTMVDIAESIIEIAKEIDPSGQRAIGYRANVALPDDVRTVTDAVACRWGPTHILVNCAGVAPKHGGVKPAFEDVAHDEWRDVMAVNLEGAFLWSQAALPGMKAAGWGRVVNISSGAGRTASPASGAAYGSSKAGLLGLTRILAAELATSGITVNSVAPGRIETRPIEIFGLEANEQYRSTIPMGRFGTPAEVAFAVVFLASDQASYITGATLDVNGGKFMG